MHRIKVKLAKLNDDERNITKFSAEVNDFTDIYNKEESA